MNEIEWDDEEFEVFSEQEETPEVKWSPVSNIDEIYKDLPKVKEFHKEYVKMWLRGRND